MRYILEAVSKPRPAVLSPSASSWGPTSRDPRVSLSLSFFSSDTGTRMRFLSSRTWCSVQFDSGWPPRSFVPSHKRTYAPPNGTHALCGGSRGNWVPVYALFRLASPVPLLLRQLDHRGTSGGSERDTRKAIYAALPDVAGNALYAIMYAPYIRFFLVFFFETRSSENSQIIVMGFDDFPCHRRNTDNIDNKEKNIDIKNKYLN